MGPSDPGQILVLISVFKLGFGEPGPWILAPFLDVDPNGDSIYA